MPNAVGGTKPDWHEVHDPAHSIGRMKTGYENVGVGPVILFGFDAIGNWRNPEVSPFVIVENCGKHTGRVKERKAEPINGSIHADQSGGLHIADESVIFNGLIGHGDNEQISANKEWPT